MTISILYFTHQTPSPPPLPPGEGLRRVGRSSSSFNFLVSDDGSGLELVTYGGWFLLRPNTDSRDLLTSNDSYSTKKRERETK